MWEIVIIAPTGATDIRVHYELEHLRGAPERGQQVLHSLRAHLAVTGLHLPLAGVPGDSRACVERRPQGF